MNKVRVALGRYQARVKRQEQWLCRALSRLLRKPLIAGSLVRLLGARPELSVPLVHRLTSDRRLKERLH